MLRITGARNECPVHPLVGIIEIDPEERKSQQGMHRPRGAWKRLLSLPFESDRICKEGARNEKIIEASRSGRGTRSMDQKGSP